MTDTTLPQKRLVNAIRLAQDYPDYTHALALLKMVACGDLHPRKAVAQEPEIFATLAAVAQDKSILDAVHQIAQLARLKEALEKPGEHEAAAMLREAAADPATPTRWRMRFAETLEKQDEHEATAMLREAAADPTTPARWRIRFGQLLRRLP